MTEGRAAVERDEILPLLMLGRVELPSRREEASTAAPVDDARRGAPCGGAENDGGGGAGGGRGRSAIREERRDGEKREAEGEKSRREVMKGSR